MPTTGVQQKTFLKHFDFSALKMALLATQAVPEFSGEATLLDGSPSMGAREFLQRVDDIMASTGAGDAAIAGAVKQRLVGAAYTWFQTLVQRESPDVNQWT